MNAIESRSRERTRTNAMLREYAAHRDPALLERLVEDFRPLVRKLARPYAARPDLREDAEQVAALALVKAIQRFDPDRGFAFTSFAVPTILGELKRSVRDTAWAARVPRPMQEDVAELRGAVEAAEQRRGVSPTARELEAWLGWDAERVVETMQAGHAISALSLDVPLATDDGDAATLVERLGTEDDGYERIEDRAAIAYALPTLTTEQRRMLDLRFRLGLKQSEIARELDCSQMQVSRTLRRALERLSAVAGHGSGSPRPSV